MALFAIHDTAMICRERDNIMVFAKDRLNDEHQRVFAEHFMLSFVDPNDKFPIDGEKAMEWLGFTRKDNFKTFVAKSIDENQYVISLLRPQERVHGGQNKEIIKISVEGFKILEMLARTERGKLIRSYYPQLEKIIMEYCISRYQEQIRKEKQMVENLKLTLKAERANFAQLANRGIIKGDKVQGVYLCQSGDESKIKVGMTSNGYARETEIRNGNIDAKIVYMKRTNNMKVLEKLVHHILHEYRISATREWFAVSFETAKAALDSAQLFMDGLVGKCSGLVSHDFYGKLKDLVESLPNIAVEETTYSDNESLSEEEEIEEGIHEEDPVEDIDIKDPLDFERFIDECCIKGDTLTCFTAEVYGAHRLWARVNEKNAHDALYKYLCENYKKTRVYHTDAQALFASFRGFALKPQEHQKDDPPTDIDQFVDDCMKLGYSCRVSTKEVIEAFTEWKSKSLPDYIMTPADKTRVEHYFSTKFLGSTVFNGKHGVYGFFGITLKTSNSYVGMKKADKLKKPIEQIDVKTRKVVQTFDSLTILARTLHKGASNMSEAIRFKKPVGGYLYRYVEKIITTNI